MIKEEAWRRTKGYLYDALSGEEADEIIKALEQESCDKCVYSIKDGYYQYEDITETIPPFEPDEDVISRQAVMDEIEFTSFDDYSDYLRIREKIEALPSVKPQLKTRHCKDCKYFEYDSVAKVDGIPLIVAHEICSRWGDGCKTKEDGYCFLFEPQENEER